MLLTVIFKNTIKTTRALQMNNIYNIGVGSHSRLQGICLTQGLTLNLLWLLHCRHILYHSATWEAQL